MTAANQPPEIGCYCINPRCVNRLNPDDSSRCLSCGMPLLINDRYRLAKPLRQLDEEYTTDVFEVEDWDINPDQENWPKVLKVLKIQETGAQILFERESTILMRLRHPNLPRVEPDGFFTVALEPPKKLPCLVMEQIEGINLRAWLRENGEITEAIALDWLRQITQLLIYVHEEGLLHRDIKPSNIILKANGELALIDFGNVGFINRAVTPVGSYGYTAPEQRSGGAVPQSDIFGLGCTIVHLLTGEYPDDLPKHRRTNKLLWRDRVQGISQQLADLLDQMISPLPQQRPANPHVLLERLQHLYDAPAEPTAENTSNPDSSGESGSQNLRLKIIFSWPFSPEQMRQAATIFLLWCIALQLVLQPIAEFCNRLGEAAITTTPAKAEFWYKTAIWVKPNYPKPYHNLGLLYEDPRFFNQKLATENYHKAAKKGFTPAVNNLARLEILAINPDAAVHLILPQLHKENLSDGVKYSLHKNLGWARAIQKRYADAEANLQMAIDLNPKRASAYCLLAQVFEDQGNINPALTQWENCLRYAQSTTTPEEDGWIEMARQRLVNYEVLLMQQRQSDVQPNPKQKPVFQPL
ncbi:MAG TPA: protein kinase [Oscillatoriaceae cyanobacterium M33_DOE_052]|uniref:Protein kinase domain-containing protein n=1 Tax=Planktothricoides sp. SpSt-374 TaxID=2282167 RepID=A0A7C3VGL1_9CYAN|nr:protein kinase [Oscillatoriaceae cyanobacterium M33_DOE_052]